MVALILSTAITLLLSTLLGMTTLGNGLAVDEKGLLILGILLLLSALYKKLRKKKPSPILMILLSAGLGMIFYSI